MTESLFASTENFTGDVLGFLTARSYAAYILTVARARKPVSTAAVMAVGGIAAILILWVLAVTIEGNVWPETLRGWTIAFALAFLVQVGGQTLIALVLAHNSRRSWVHAALSSAHSRSVFRVGIVWRDH